MSAYLTALTGAGTTVAVGLVAVARSWPQPTGRHRAPKPRGAAVPQVLLECEPCGRVVAATVHGDLLRCADGHETQAVTS